MPNGDRGLRVRGEPAPVAKAVYSLARTVGISFSWVNGEAPPLFTTVHKRSFGVRFMY